MSPLVVSVPLTEKSCLKKDLQDNVLSDIFLARLQHIINRDVSHRMK